MNNNEKDILKRGEEKAPKDFTISLMHRIDANEKTFSKALSKNVIIKPSSDFTAELMQKLEGKTPKAPYKSVIPESVWIGIGAFFVGVNIVAFTLNENGSEKFYIQEYTQKTTEAINVFSDSPILFYTILGVLILSLSLFVEQLIRKNRVH